MEMNDLKDALRQSWGKEIAYHGEWYANDPGWGTCVPTALVVQDYFGGELMRTWGADNWHFFNRLSDGRFVDMTLKRPNLRKNSSFLKRAFVAKREDLFRTNHVAVRYKILSERVRNKINRPVKRTAVRRKRDS